jgi:DNA ligase D
VAKTDGAIVVPLAGHDVRITSPDKVFFPKAGATKLDLVRYYEAVAGPLMATMQGRPLLMERYPEGATGKSFFQKRVPKGIPDWLQTTTVETPNGTTSEALVGADVAHVAWAVNIGCLGFHVWPYEAGSPEVIVELRVDLDPSPGVVYDQVRETAHRTRELLTELGIRSFVKTSGSKGLHIYVRLLPNWDSYQVRAAAVALARELERRHPDLITAKWWKEERGTRVFVDFNQNAPHKTVFGAWCVRARPGAQVSTPFRWDELPAIHPDDLTMATVPGRVADGGDPWEAIDDEPQSIEPLVARYRDDLARGIPDAPWPPVYPKMPDEARRVNPSRARLDDE